MSNREETAPSNERVQISASVTKELYEAFNEIFFEAGGKYRTRSEVVREALEKYAKNNGKL